MPDREKVIQKLEKSFKEMRTNRICMEDVIELEEAAADALTLLKGQEARWIPVAERMPEDGEIVLCAVYGTDMIVWENGESIEDAVRRARSGPGRVETGYLDADGYWTDTAFGGPMMVTPRYWMPLPEPPKEEDDAG